MIKIATHNIKLYKAFRGSNSRAVAPYMGTSWGILASGKVLSPYYFSPGGGICRPGIHASDSIHDAGLSSLNVIWAVIIPKGTRYYKSSIAEAQRMYHEKAKGPVFRAEKVKLVRQIKSRRKS